MKYIKSPNGYYYKEYINGKKVRISEKVYNIFKEKKTVNKKSIMNGGVYTTQEDIKNFLNENLNTHISTTLNNLNRYNNIYIYDWANLWHSSNTKYSNTELMYILLEYINNNSDNYHIIVHGIKIKEWFNHQGSNIDSNIFNFNTNIKIIQLNTSQITNIDDIVCIFLQYKLQQYYNPSKIIVCSNDLYRSELNIAHNINRNKSAIVPMITVKNIIPQFDSTLISRAENIEKTTQFLESVLSKNTHVPFPFLINSLMFSTKGNGQIQLLYQFNVINVKKVSSRKRQMTGYNILKISTSFPFSSLLNYMTEIKLIDYIIIPIYETPYGNYNNNQKYLYETAHKWNSVTLNKQNIDTSLFFDIDNLLETYIYIMQMENINSSTKNTYYKSIQQLYPTIYPELLKIIMSNPDFEKIIMSNPELLKIIMSYPDFEKIKKGISQRLVQPFNNKLKKIEKN